METNAKELELHGRLYVLQERLEQVEQQMCAIHVRREHSQSIEE